MWWLNERDFSWRKLTLFASLYFLACYGALALRFQPINVVIVWPASGLAIVGLVVTRKSLWRHCGAAIVLANATASFLQGSTWAAALGFAAANLSEVLLAAWLLRRLQAVSIKRLRSCVAFVAIASVLAPAAGAALGSLVVEYVYSLSFSQTWATWLVADSLGILLWVPLTLSFLFVRSHWSSGRSASWWEYCCFSISFLGMAAWIFSADEAFAAVGFRRPYVLATWQVWAAMRFPTGGIALANLATAFMGLGSCVLGIGPFAVAGHSPAWNLFDAQIFVANLVALTLIVSAAIHEHGALTQKLHRTVDCLHEMRALAEERTRRLWCSTTQLQESRLAAELASQAKGDFLTNMSHEIRTPLTAILGYTELLQERATAADDIADLRTVRNSSEHLLAVINDILDFAKIESGKLELENLACDLRGLIDDCSNLFVLRAKEKGLLLSAEVAPETPPTICTDPTRFKQILFNLLGNAIKFTEVGQVSLSVHYVDTQVVVCVRDSGIGMSPEQLSRLFQPFAQAENSTSRRYGGSGLGLSISRQLAELLGGELTVESVLGSGSAFTLALAPSLSRSGDAKDATSVQTTPSEAPAAPSLSGLRILVADDAAENVRLFRRILESAGATVTAVEDGAAALCTAQTAGDFDAPFDVILMDAQMPILGGYEAVRRLRAAGYGQPVIALTADSTHQSQLAALQAGCNAFLAKPVTKTALLMEVQRVSAAVVTADFADNYS